MKISQLCHRSVVTCTDRDHADQAASLMWSNNIGCLPVLGDNGRLVGMVTDRDIAIGALLQGAPLRAITVSTVMSKEVLTCREDDDAETVLKLLFGRRLRRIPLIDDDRRVLGIVSLNDIARAAANNELGPAGIVALTQAIAVPRSLAVNRP